MIDKLLGAYFLEKGKLSPEQIKQIEQVQAQVRVKLGLIAVSEKLMTNEQADEVNRLQSVMDKRFGDIAVEKGYLTEDQVSRLLGLQGNGYLSFVQTVIDNGMMALHEIEEGLIDYQKENGFTASDIDALKSDDPDRIVPLFLPQDIDKYQKEHILGAFRAVTRLICNGACVSKAYKAESMKTNAFASQGLDGEKKASLTFVGEGNNLNAIADKFAGETFEEVDLDSLDAVAEFINCINGMYATKVAPDLNVDMLPPAYKAEACELTGDMIVLPIYIGDKKVELVSTFGQIVNY
ncbi:MAG: hypothetical protein MJ126_00815 [Lachnospiraceae bacterium]|nr:hypothetical protein [Lachnospiraceae bacterium]